MSQASGGGRRSNCKLLALQGAINDATVEKRGFARSKFHSLGIGMCIALLGKLKKHFERQVSRTMIYQIADNDISDSL